MTESLRDPYLTPTQSFVKDSRGSPTVSTATPSTYYARGRSRAPGRCQWTEWSSDDDLSDGARAVSTKPASKKIKSSLRGAPHSEHSADQDDTKSDSERQRTSGRGRRCDDERSRRSRHRRSQVSFCESTSESDSDIERSQRKQFMKAPKFDGSGMSFETFLSLIHI